MTKLRVLRPLLPVTLLVTGACFATRNDVRILQGDILTLRQEAARADSARRRQNDALSAQLASNMSVVNDSLRSLGGRMATAQGESRGEFRAVKEMLIQLQELVGQSQAIINRMRADTEARFLQQQMVAQAPPPAAAATTDTAGAAARPATPPTVQVGPSQLYLEGLNQARRGSYAAAQAAFEELLTSHPDFDQAPDAMAFLADAYDADGKHAQADSTWLKVVAQYPRSPRAPTALYKMGLSLARRGRRAEARAAMERTTREYPVSDAADLARDWLMRNR